MTLSLSKAIEDDLPDQLYLPEPLKLLFNWIEEKGFILRFEGNDIRGFLKDIEEESTIEDDEGNEVIVNGTSAGFSPQDDIDKKHYKEAYGDKSNNLYIFARTGGDGSSAAFWLDENGNQKIVHIGSGSGSTLFCILTDDPVDFIRLLAIGYEEICWLDSIENISEPPNQTDKEEKLIFPNKEFQTWVKDTFSTTIPKTAIEIFDKPATMDEDSSEDAFWKWDKKYGKHWN